MLIKDIKVNKVIKVIKVMVAKLGTNVSGAKSNLKLVF